MRSVLVVSVLCMLVLAGCAAPIDREPAPETAPIPVAYQHGALRALADAVQNGTPVLHTSKVVGPAGWLPDVELTITWRPAYTLHADTWAMIEDNHTELPFIGTAEGDVDGMPGAAARVTWTAQWARGTVYHQGSTYYIFIGAAPGQGSPQYWHPPEQDLDAAASGQATRHGHAAPGVLARECGGMTNPPEVDRALPYLPDFQGTPLRLRLIADTDHGVLATHGADTWAVIVAYVMEMDGLYAQQTGLRIDLVGVHLHAEPRFQIDAPATSELLDGFSWPLTVAQEYWLERPELLQTSDVLHLFAGWTGPGGQAGSIGGVGSGDRTQISFSSAWYYGVDAASAGFVTGQEIGHVLGGQHHYGNMVEGRGATVIMHGYGPGNHAVISSTNRAAVRECTEPALQEWQARNTAA